jgi:hypothetical protein
MTNYTHTRSSPRHGAASRRSPEVLPKADRLPGRAPEAAGWPAAYMTLPFGAAAVVELRKWGLQHWLFWHAAAVRALAGQLEFMAQRGAAGMIPAPAKRAGPIDNG